MGIEIVFVLIYPVATIFIGLSFILWRCGLGNRFNEFGFMPLLIGLLFLMSGVALFTFVERSQDFTRLVASGHYVEAQRAEFLPGRITGQAIVILLFLLPLTSAIVVPVIARLIRLQRLTLLTAVLVGTASGLLMGLGAWPLPAPAMELWKGLAFSVLTMGLPIPSTAFLFARLKRPANPERLNTI